MNHPSQVEVGKQAGIREALEKVLLDQAPTSVVIEPDGEIVYIHGHTGKYLELPPGAGVSTNLFRMAREGLSAPLMAAVYRAASRKELVVYRDLRVKTDGGLQTLDLIVRPLPEAPAGQELLLVTLPEREPAVAPALLAAPATAPAVESGAEEQDADPHARRIAELERKLQSTQEYPQSMVEALQASNEELQSTKLRINAGIGCRSGRIDPPRTWSKASC